MKPEIRDAFIDGLEQVFKQAGEESYDAAMAKLIRNTERFLYGLNLLRTQEHVAALMDVIPDPSPEEELIALSVGKFLPHLAAMTVGEAVQKFIKEASATSGGRPNSLQHDDTVAMVREIGKLITEGYTSAVAKRHAARKFGVSVRTAERRWRERGKILDGEREITLQEAKDWFNNLLEKPGPLLPEIPPKLLEK